jgi:hypothetical protein
MDWWMCKWIQHRNIDNNKYWVREVDIDMELDPVISRSVVAMNGDVRHPYESVAEVTTPLFRMVSRDLFWFIFASGYQDN